MKILVVCLGNINRSPVAEALLRRAGSMHGHAGPLYVRSRGLKVRWHARASLKARHYAASIGLDLEAHLAQQLTAADVRWADVVLTMSERHTQAVHALATPLCCVNLAAMVGVKSVPDPGFMRTDSPETQQAFSLLTTCVIKFVQRTEQQL